MKADVRVTLINSKPIIPGAFSRRVKFLFLPALVFILAGQVLGQERAGDRRIPLLISDHHGDHALWFYRQSAHNRAALIVADAHADTISDPPGRERMRQFFHEKNFNAADSFIKNHNWIYFLTPFPVASLIWISKISGPPSAERLSGFIKSTSSWEIKNPRCVSLDELGMNLIDRELFNSPYEKSGDDGPLFPSLFISIDLDFFYNENYTPQDIPHVFDKLFQFSLNWEGKVFWALCVSLAWLPNLEYAHRLLEESLTWLISKKEFESPTLTLFDSLRYDTSRRAEVLRAAGTEAPGFYGKEDKMPSHIMELFNDLSWRD